MEEEDIKKWGEGSHGEAKGNLGAQEQNQKRIEQNNRKNNKENSSLKKEVCVFSSTSSHSQSLRPLHAKVKVNN